MICAGASFLQADKEGDKQVQIVAFSHEKNVGCITVSGDVLSSIIPLRSVLDSVGDPNIVDFSTFKDRQAQLLKQYETGETERETEERLKHLDSTLQAATSELKQAKAEVTLLRSREKSLKEKLENATSAGERDLEKEKAKNKKLAKDIKELETSAEKADSSAAEASRFRAQVKDMNREVEKLRSENQDLRDELERANKRQRTNESGEYRPVSSVPPSAASTPFDISHFESMRVKSISFSATY